MEITWYGQACFKIKSKSGTQVVIDPFDPEMVGLKLPKDLSGEVALQTHSHADHSNLNAVLDNPVRIVGPGEYEVSGILINGISSFHDKDQGASRGKNTIYHLQIDGLNLVHLGDLGHLLTQDQIEGIGATDILCLPVGGVFTIDSKEAAEVVAQLEPRIIIPMHYFLPGLKFELEGVEAFLKEMGAENSQPVPKLVITKDKLPEEQQVLVLAKS